MFPFDDVIMFVHIVYTDASGTFLCDKQNQAYILRGVGSI